MSHVEGVDPFPCCPSPRIGRTQRAAPAETEPRWRAAGERGLPLPAPS